MSHAGDMIFSGCLVSLFIMLFQPSSDGDNSVGTSGVVLQPHELFNKREQGKLMVLLRDKCCIQYWKWKQHDSSFCKFSPYSGGHLILRFRPAGADWNIQTQESGIKDSEVSKETAASVAVLRCVKIRR